MSAGDIVREGGLDVETMDMASAVDATKGAVYVNAGSGMTLALTTHKGPYFVAYQSAVYADTTDPFYADHKVPFVKKGNIVVLCDLSGGAIKKGQPVKITGTSGKVMLSTISAEAEVVGVANEDAATTASVLEIILGGLA